MFNTFPSMPGDDFNFNSFDSISEYVCNSFNSFSEYVFDLNTISISYFIYNQIFLILIKNENFMFNMLILFNQLFLIYGLFLQFQQMDYTS